MKEGGNKLPQGPLCIEAEGKLVSMAYSSNESGTPSPLYGFHTAAVTNYYKMGGLK